MMLDRCVWTRSPSGQYGYPSCEKTSVTLNKVFHITVCPRCHKPIQWRDK